jgi:conjugative relaxase-like TrwC/TraI family protein
MGADEVAYHQATVVDRGDDHAGRALDYYGSRGETPLRWAGAGARRLGLSGEVTPGAYKAAFGPGGFAHPTSGARLVGTHRPGFELVVAAHKSVALLGVMGDADAMHSILDVETTMTMDWLDGWFQDRGGRRGRAQTRTATGGLTYAVTRHATSRAGDPAPHDHVLVANVVEMLDDTGGYKGLDSAALRDTVEAATMVGRLHAAWQAVGFGFDVRVDDGPSGRLRHWRIVGVPDEVCELFSKRSDEIAEHLAATGQDSYRARGIAARQTRAVKRHTGPDELLAGWHAELEQVGWPVERLAAHLAASQERSRGLAFPLTAAEIDRIADDVLDVDGALLARHKIFTRTHLVAELAPRLYGRDPAELDRVLDRITARRDVVSLIGVSGVREQCYTTVEVLAAEQTISRTVEILGGLPGPALAPSVTAAAIASTEQTLGRALTDSQREVVEHLCGSGRAASVVVGVAGSGKTAALDAATTALTAAGYQVIGTSTTGQAARTLATEADVDARTFASLLWRLDHGTVTLDERSVVIVDETGMADDADLARLVLAVERGRASLVLVGDHRQLAAIGPGGALAALLDRRPQLTVTLDDNVRQTEPGEREALAELRAGSVSAAVAWYANTERIHTQPTRTDTLIAMTDAWARDIAADHDTALLAWRRADVHDLNRLARHHWHQLGHLHGDDITVTHGRTYAVGDRVVALAPNSHAGIVTSEQLTVTAVTPDRIDARTSTDRNVTLTGDAIDVDHLDYAYALTVHRAQGATCDRAHVLAAGGGRELAYVALSRARDHTTVHATADNIQQVANDLETDWSTETHQRWITDTPARPGDHPEPHSAAAADVPPAVVPSAAATLDPARQLRVLTDDYHDLQAGTGRWTHTPAGTAARARNQTRAQLDSAQRNARNANLRRRDRRAAAKSINTLTAAQAHAEHQWQELGEPLAEQFRNQITTTRHEVERQHLTEVRRRLDRHFNSRLPEPSIDHGRDLGIGL